MSKEDEVPQCGANRMIDLDEMMLDPAGEKTPKKAIEVCVLDAMHEGDHDWEIDPSKL
jgi:hypothetical protein